MKPLCALILMSLGTSVAYAGSPDKAFYFKAAAGGLEEVQGGRLAQEKGGSEAVKSMGAKVVEDHTAANEKLASIAASKHLKLPKTPDAKQRAMLKKLQAKSGAAFDTAYIKEEIADHKATAALMQREATYGKDAEAKAFAAETLSVVKEHLSMLQNMQSGSDMGGPTGANMPMAPAK